MHQHARAQLAYAVSGSMTVSTPSALWVVPPTRAVWIPARTDHKIESPRAYQLRTAYVEPSQFSDLPREVGVIEVSPLLREIIVEFTRIDWNYESGSPASRLAQVLVDQLVAGSSVPLSLPLPKEPRVARVCQALAEDPANSDELVAWAKRAGASERNLARLFLKDLGMTFREYRTQLRLLRAAELLGAGHDVLEVGLEVGYTSSSAFSTAFKRAFGSSPGRFAG